MVIRKAVEKDISSVASIYNAIHTAEEAGEATIGWVRGVYPTEKTAQAALKRLAAARARIIGALLTHYDSKAAGYGYDYDSYYAYGTAPRIGNG